MAFALDFGNLNTTITKVMKGGVDVILNEVRAPPEHIASVRCNAAIADELAERGTAHHRRSSEFREQQSRQHGRVVRPPGRIFPASQLFECCVAVVVCLQASKRQNPTLVSFGGNERYIGEAATSQIRTNMDNTVTQVKRLLGRKFSEPGIAEELAVHLNYKLVQLKNDDIGIEVCACVRCPLGGLFLPLPCRHLSHAWRPMFAHFSMALSITPPTSRRCSTTTKRASSRRRKC